MSSTLFSFHDVIISLLTWPGIAVSNFPYNFERNDYLDHRLHLAYTHLHKAIQFCYLIVCKKKGKQIEVSLIVLKKETGKISAWKKKQGVVRQGKWKTLVKKKNDGKVKSY